MTRPVGRSPWYQVRIPDANVQHLAWRDPYLFLDPTRTRIVCECEQGGTKVGRKPRRGSFFKKAAREPDPIPPLVLDVSEIREMRADPSEPLRLALVDRPRRCVCASKDRRSDVQTCDISNS